MGNGCLNCRVNQRQSQRYMKLANEMPQLLDSNTKHAAHFDSIRSAIAYLSAPEEVKSEVDSSTEPVTEPSLSINQ